MTSCATRQCCQPSPQYPAWAPHRACTATPALCVPPPSATHYRTPSHSGSPQPRRRPPPRLHRPPALPWRSAALRALPPSLGSPPSPPTPSLPFCSGACCTALHRRSAPPPHLTLSSFPFNPLLGSVPSPASLNALSPPSRSGACGRCSGCRTTGFPGVCPSPGAAPSLRAAPPLLAPPPLRAAPPLRASPP